MKKAMKFANVLLAATVVTAVTSAWMPVQTFASTAYPNYDGKTLDYGIYWFGLNNANQKFVKGTSNPYFDPKKPTVIFVHGWQPNTTTTLWRTSFNYALNDSTWGTNVNEADAWVKAGWNIGIFQWNQFADETAVGDAEAKIWTANGPQLMRWKNVNGVYSAGPTVSAGQLFHDTFVDAMNGYSGTNIRIAGHSLGNQMAVQLSEMISNDITAGKLPANLLPKRVALLDPYWTTGTKSYLGNVTNNQKVYDYIVDLKSKGVSFEYYHSSTLNDTGGDSNTRVQQVCALEYLTPSYISTADQTGRHNQAYNWYFWSYANPAPSEYTASGTNSYTATGNAALSASTTDSNVTQMMGMANKWSQVYGASTASPSDDGFQIQAK